MQQDEGAWDGWAHGEPRGGAQGRALLQRTSSSGSWLHECAVVLDAAAAAAAAAASEPLGHEGQDACPGHPEPEVAPLAQAAAGGAPRAEAPAPAPKPAPLLRAKPSLPAQARCQAAPRLAPRRWRRARR
jgi:hypothetical protein